MPAALRDSMATAMSNHGHEVYGAMGRVNQHYAGLDQHQVLEVTKQV